MKSITSSTLASFTFVFAEYAMFALPAVALPPVRTALPPVEQADTETTTNVSFTSMRRFN